MAPNAEHAAVQRQLAAAMLSVVYLPTAWAQVCYYPSGKQSGDVPCKVGNGHSTCCGRSGWECTDANLCRNTTTTQLLRSSCTDPTWQDPACPKFCLDEDQSFDVQLDPCYQNETLTLACCTYYTSCTCWSDPMVVLGPLQIAKPPQGTSVSYTTTNGAKFPLRTFAATQQSAIARQFAWTAASAQSISSAGPQNGGGGGVGRESSLTAGDGAAIGVGVMLGLVLLALAVGFVFWRRRKARWSRGKGSGAQESGHTPSYTGSNLGGHFVYDKTGQPEVDENGAVELEGRE